MKPIKRETPQARFQKRITGFQNQMDKTMKSARRQVRYGFWASLCGYMLGLFGFIGVGIIVILFLMHVFYS